MLKKMWINRSQRHELETNGYTLLPGIVPAHLADAVTKAIFDFSDIDPNHTGSWHPTSLHDSGMVEMYQHQAMWNIRQLPAVHKVFSELYNTSKLWVTIDRANCKPPYSSAHSRFHNKSFLHLDPPSLEPKERVSDYKSLIFLQDTDVDQGTFHCLPGWHNRSAEWRSCRPEDNPYADMNSDEMSLVSEAPVPIPGCKGDMLIWIDRLPHGSGNNISNKFRLAMYIGMTPASPGTSDWINERVNSWQNRTAPQEPWVRVVDALREPQLQPQPARLSRLGKRLLGLQTWYPKSIRDWLY